MPYTLKCWPVSVYEREVLKLHPDIRGPVVVALNDLREQGPQPDGYSNCKNLGKDLAYLWQLGFKTDRNEQMRLLYYTAGNAITLLMVFKKTKPEEEQRAYKVAMRRKKEAEMNDGGPTIH